MKITVNGTEYEIPAGESLKMGEWQIVERYCGGHVDDDGYSISKVMGFVHVAIARAEPAVPSAEIQAAVEALTMADMPAPDQDGQSPPAPVTSPLLETLEGSGINGSDANRDSKTPSGTGTTG